MYGPGLVRFNDGYVVASMDSSSEYEVILLTGEGTTWDRQGLELPPALHGSHHGYFVRIFYVAAGWNSGGNAGYADGR
jgi:hypothetical protein